MSRILFGCVPYWGHMNPTIAVAQQLIKMGHTVAYACHPDMKEGLDKAGIPAIDKYAFGNLFAVTSKLTHDKRAARKEGKKWKSELEQDTTNFISLIREWQPDVCVMDVIFMPGIIAAEACNIPLAISCPYPFIQLPSKDLLPNGFGFASYQKRPGFLSGLILLLAGLFTRVVTGPINDVRVKAGLAPTYRPFGDVGDLHFTYTTAAFDFERSDLPRQVYYLGPSVSKELAGADVDFPWEWLDGRPLIYCTMGTIHSKPAVFKKIIAASRNAPWQIVLAVTRQIDTALFEEVPENVLIRNFVPQSTLLRKASLVICAANGNTTNESLLLGLPLLMLPQVSDHFDAAQRAVEAGVALRIDPPALTVAKARRAIERLLNEPGFREQALALSLDFKKCNAPLAAAGLLEKLAQLKRPLLRPVQVSPTLYSKDLDQVLALLN
ncbi:hypothetical protein KTO58_09045 [Chitinophaga pendula]|uniref:glycosyltransferase n=1 Tax=Chitinophaga TaxID=79328 RepID=UPI000BB05075|nr:MULTISPECIES: nucleotide disphospho-sugar-binding domain-containing protein [Chitinophaga]ASZ13064.1 hypothetical protein CK934_19925 [Chitinophaga sp. MD30]UCJ09314.1 hypothetical protein KTO58_09045 [Chitinophaga pendula]